MGRSLRVGAIVPLGLTLGAAEAAVRLLAPRERPPVPAPVALSEVFSHEEIRRGRAFARPQRVLALARGAVETAVLVALIRRPPRGLDRIAPGAA
ncbi:MAG: hypothetical protein M3Z27_02095, partial [Actinomycetota bacterium]|nr:hypothetical protein [Actinomycetota bacterium]